MNTNKLFHSGNLIITGFVIALLSMSFLIYKSLKQEVEMVSTNYYEQEINYQKNINAKSNADTYTTQFNLLNIKDTITIQIPTELSQSFTNANIHFYCTSDIKQDKIIPLTPNEHGKYSFETTGWKKTNYIAKVRIIQNNKTFLKEISFNL